MSYYCKILLNVVKFMQNVVVSNIITNLLHSESLETSNFFIKFNDKTDTQDPKTLHLKIKTITFTLDHLRCLGTNVVSRTTSLLTDYERFLDLLFSFLCNTILQYLQLLQNEHMNP